MAIKGFIRRPSLASLRPSSREGEATSAPTSPPETQRLAGRASWPWRGWAALALAVLLLGVWCAYTLETRQLDRAAKVLRHKARHKAEIERKFTGNASEVGLLTRPSPCAEALKIPQVAFMFLVKGENPHEAAWSLWLEQIAGEVPAQFLVGRGAPAACQRDAEQEPSLLHPAIARQNLFTFYTHTDAKFEGLSPGSLFFGTELAREERAATSWGSHALVTATKALLRAALRQPLNHKLVLVSETTLPLYDPFFSYRQLLHSPKSAINACNETGWYRAADQRWVPEFETAELKLHHWRKSWQWFALNRLHAQVVLDDSRVERQFELYCKRNWSPEWKNYRVCYSDEHYIPTLLAVQGRDNETDCAGEATDVNWDRRSDKYSPHPYEYTRWDLRPALVPVLRRAARPECRHGVAQSRAARAGFVDAGAELEAGAAAAAAARGDKFIPLGRMCPLLARKFVPAIAPHALALLLRCEPEVGILQGAACRPGHGLSHDLAAAALPWAGVLAVVAAAGLLAGALAALVDGGAGAASSRLTKALSSSEPRLLDLAAEALGERRAEEGKPMPRSASVARLVAAGSRNRTVAASSP